MAPLTAHFWAHKHTQPTHKTHAQTHSGEPRELHAKLTAAGHPLNAHPQSAAALADMGTLFEYLDAMGALGRLSFDLSLARGLDYYTGARPCTRA